MELWTTYSDMRNKEFQEDGDGSGATAFYLANREAMDAGAEVSCRNDTAKTRFPGCNSA